tara:strand:+ start:281 stop:949 length:669 start_codon:yes stop_codon:yes gene_type:complete
MWIQESIKKGKRMKDHYNMNGVDIFIKDPLPDNIDAEFVFDYISTRVPFYLLVNIDVVYVGLFPEMVERDINAFYENDAIYVTNDQEDEMDMIEDIIHEISHAVEKSVGDIIYGDGALQREFMAKRSRLSDLLSQKFDVPSDFNINFEYDKDIDSFLFKVVGYDILNQVSTNIFLSGYAATSLSEYWAMGFEEMFLGDPKKIKKMCPVLYNRLAMTIKELKE